MLLALQDWITTVYKAAARIEISWSFIRNFKTVSNTTLERSDFMRELLTWNDILIITWGL